jgi:hypothetical protein
VLLSTIFLPISDDCCSGSRCRICRWRSAPVCKAARSMPASAAELRNAKSLRGAGAPGGGGRRAGARRKGASGEPASVGWRTRRGGPSCRGGGAAGAVCDCAWASVGGAEERGEDGSGRTEVGRRGGGVCCEAKARARGVVKRGGGEKVRGARGRWASVLLRLLVDGSTDAERRRAARRRACIGRCAAAARHTSAAGSTEGVRAAAGRQERCTAGRAEAEDGKQGAPGRRRYWRGPQAQARAGLLRVSRSSGTQPAGCWLARHNTRAPRIAGSHRGAPRRIPLAACYHTTSAACPSTASLLPVLGLRCSAPPTRGLGRLRCARASRSRALRPPEAAHAPHERAAQMELSCERLPSSCEAWPAAVWTSTCSRRLHSQTLPSDRLHELKGHAVLPSG